MGYTSEFKLGADPDRDCGFIYISDLSTYPISSPARERNELGIALFWSIDEYTNIRGCDLSNSEEWYISTENNYTFNIKGCIVDIWSSSTTYNAGTQWKIVWFENYFYIQSVANPSGQPGASGTTGWSLIQIGETDPVGGGTIDDYKDIYDLFEYSLNDQSQNIGWSTINVGINCLLYTLEKTDCHQWNVHDNTSGGVTVSKIQLRTYDNVLLDDELLFVDNVLSINLENYEGGDDGVYVIEIYGSEVGDLENSLKAELVIYDLCDSEECYKQLFRYIICKCNDPCDDSDCEDQYNIQEKRYDMNMIWGLYTLIEKYIFLDRYKYLGILTINSQREDFITTVGQMVDKLKIITERCGNCTEDSNNDITC
jgi:hypothetical protein